MSAVSRDADDEVVPDDEDRRGARRGVKLVGGARYFKDDRIVR